jgi:T-complex protein 1 subunit delta
MKILVLRDIERDEVEFVCKSLGCRPVAHIDSLTPDMLGHADLVEEVSAGDSKIVQVRGSRCFCGACRPFLPHFKKIPAPLISVPQPCAAPNQITGAEKRGKTVSIVVRGSSKLVVAEAERSIHDALCVIRCLVKKPFLIAGGGAPEIEVALRLAERSQALTGSEAYCVRAFAEAMEVCVCFGLWLGMWLWSGEGGRTECRLKPDPHHCLILFYCFE